MEDQQTRKERIKINYIVQTEVNRVENIDGIWYVNFLGSWESLAFGETKPWEVGAKIKITFEEVTDEVPIQQSGSVSS